MWSVTVAPSAAAHQARAAGLVADFPAELGELVANGIGALKVLGGARFLALREQALGLGVRGVLPGQERLEPEQRQQLLERPPRAWKLTAVALPDQLGDLGVGAGGVEVVGEGIEERLAALADERIALAAGGC